LVEADVAAINGHGLGVGREGDDARAVVETDVAHLEFVGEGGGAAAAARAANLKVIFAMGDDGFGESEEVRVVVGEPDVLDGTGVIFGGEEIVTIGEAEALADVFEGVGPGETDADGFFAEYEGLEFSGVESVFGENPGELMGHEVIGEGAVV